MAGRITAGRQASRHSDETLVELKIFTDRIIRIFTEFNEGTVLLQCY